MANVSSLAPLFRHFFPSSSKLIFFPRLNGFAGCLPPLSRTEAPPLRTRLAAPRRPQDFRFSTRKAVGFRHLHWPRLGPACFHEPQARVGGASRVHGGGLLQEEGAGRGVGAHCSRGALGTLQWWRFPRETRRVMRFSAKPRSSKDVNTAAAGRKITALASSAHSAAPVMPRVSTVYDAPPRPFKIAAPSPATPRHAASLPSANHNARQAQRAPAGREHCARHPLCAI